MAAVISGTIRKNPRISLKDYERSIARKVDEIGACSSSGKDHLSAKLAELWNYLSISCKDFQIHPKNLKEVDKTKAFVLKIFELADSDTKFEQELIERCKELSIVLSVISKIDSKPKIWWKSHKNEKFSVLNHYREDFTADDGKLYDFIAKFLADSLARDHLGLAEELDPDFIGIESFADSDGLPLIHLATKAGNSEIVKILLSLNCDPTVEVKGVNAQDLALQGRHSELLLTFAKANFPYPKEIKLNELSEEFKNFYKNTQELHDAIQVENHQRVEEIVTQNKHKLKYFLNIDNQSAALSAIIKNDLTAYELLIKNEVFLAQHEVTDETFQNLKEKMKRKIREIHQKYSQEDPDNFINILMLNSRSAHDGPEAKKNLGLIRKLLVTLSKNKQCRDILELAAVSGIKFIFDFLRAATLGIDPTTGSNSEGVFYLSGKIFIGALEIFENSHKVAGTIIHELTHFVMLIVYKNDCKPYTSSDAERQKQFQKITEKCQQEAGIEEIVDLVFSCYPEEFFHDELIVRVPHMTAFYMENQVQLRDLQQAFFGLFEYFKVQVMPDILNVIPKFRILSQSILKFKELPEEYKEEVKKGLVLYKGTELTLSELFSKDSNVFNSLSTEHIKQILDQKILDFSDPHHAYLDRQIQHTWTHLAGDLKEKFLNSCFLFQNENFTFDALHAAVPKAYNKLSHEQIRAVFNGEILKVGNGKKIKSEFYFERRFRKVLGVVDDGDVRKTMNKFFESLSYDDVINCFLKKFPHEEFLTQSDLCLKYLATSSEVSQKLELPPILAKTMNETRFLILSDEAGMGKTATFEQLAMSLKRQFPTKWVTFVDLKNYTKFYNPSGTLEDLEGLLLNVLELNKVDSFSKAVFKELYSSGQFVLLWNGFDEISPTYSRFIENVMLKIHKESKNVQLVCTRPLYGGQLEKLFSSEKYGLCPFTVKERKDFLEKCLISRGLAGTELKNVTECIYEIAKKYDYETALMLTMIGEVHGEPDLLNSRNLFKIYEIFVKKKNKIWTQKNNFSLVDLSFATGKTINLKIIYQKFALLTLFSELSTKHLKIMKVEIPRELPLHEISRMGILFINSEDEFEFSHMTFAEFFVAQYLIENLYLIQNGTDFDENILELFTDLRNQTVVASFIVNFLDSDTGSEVKPFCPEIVQLLTTAKHKKILFKMLWGPSETKVFEMIFKFFSKDHKLLTELLHVNEDETLYTAVFNPSYNARHIDPVRIKEHGRKYLTHEEFQKFAAGRNQKGKILFGIAVHKLLWMETKTHNELNLDSIELNEQFLWNFFENVKSHLTQKEQKELLMSMMGENFDLFTSNFKAFLLQDLWTANENNLSKNEKKTILGAALSLCNILNYEDSQNVYLNLRFFEFLFKNVKIFFLNCEIFQLYKSHKLLHKTAKDNRIFNNFWEFFVSHTDMDQRKELLMEKVSYGSICLYFENASGCTVYDSTPFNLFHFSLFNLEKFASFSAVAEIYENHFSKAKISKMILESNEFVPYMIRFADVATCKKCFNFLEKLFKGNEKVLLKFLTGKDPRTGFTVKTYLQGIRQNCEKQLCYFEDYVATLKLHVKHDF